MRRLLFVIAFTAAACLQDRAALALDGSVVSTSGGTAVADAKIDVEVSDVLKPDVAATDRDGRFLIEMHRHFSDDERDTYGVTLTVQADGFMPVTRVFQIPERGRFDQLAGLRIEMVPVAGGATLSDEEKAAVSEQVTQQGYALYLLPFDMDHPDGPETFDLHDFAGALRRSIVPHIQALPVADPPQDLTIRPIAIEVGTNDAERIMAYGLYLKGLAMVTGEMFIEPNQDGTQVELSSSFQIVPQVEGYGPGSLFVDDLIPAEAGSASRLARKISPFWKMASVLAIGVHEYKQAMAGAPADQAALRRIRTYLAAQKAEARADMQTFVRQLDRLISRIDGELTGS